MSAERERAAPEPAPLLRPYTNVGLNFLQRHIVTIIGVVATAACLPYGFYYALTTPWLLVPMVIPIAVLMILTIWALPDSRFLPNTSLERMFFAYFAALTLWPNYIAVDLPGLPWITLGRVVNVPLVLLLLVTVSMSAEFRQRMGKVLSASPIVWKALVIFMVFQTLSLPFSDKPNFTIARYIIKQTNETAVFFLCAYIFARPGRTQIWGYMLWGVAMIVTLIGFLEYVNEQPIWSGHIPGWLLIQDETVARILSGTSRNTTGQYRTSSVFSTPLGLSEFLALALPFMMHFAASPNYRFLVRLAAAVSVIFVWQVILETDSRLGVLGLFLSLMLYLLYWAILNWRRHRGSLIPTAILAAYPTIFVMFIVASFTVGRIRAKVWGTGQYSDSNQARIDQLHQGIPMVITHPLGHGVGMGADALGFTNLAGTLTIDNYLLNVALESGFLGMVAFVAMFAVSAWTASKHALSMGKRDPEYEFLIPLGISLIVFLVGKTVFAEDDSHPLMFMVMGVVAGLAYRIQQQGAVLKAKI